MQCSIRLKSQGWPEAAELVLIALLPKAEGGYRAIGLLPFPSAALDEDEEKCGRGVGGIHAEAVPVR